MFTFAWEHNVLSLRDIVCIPLQIDGHYFQFFSTKKRKKRTRKFGFFCFALTRRIP